MNPSPLKPFNLQPGRVLASKYRVEQFLGSGYEGEVYRVIEERTGAVRAAKIFYPERNTKDAAVRFYAGKLERLRRCSIVTQFHHTEAIRLRGAPVTVLISELVEGTLLTSLVLGRRGKRLPEFEAMVLLHAMACGLAEVHQEGEYHGDLHSDNVLVRRVGVGFECMLIDFHNNGRSTREMIASDVADLIRLFYDVLGGPRVYAGHSAPVKHICAGLRKTLIRKRFPNATALVDHLETFDWEA